MSWVLLSVLAASVGLFRAAGGDTGSNVPEVFFAVRDASTELVEVETATGRHRRTLLDFGPPGGEPQPSDISPTITIQTVDLAPDGKALYFGRFSKAERFAIYRINLVSGDEERIASGRGPSVSPDGQRLAFAEETRIRVRDLRTGSEQTFEDIFGVFGGITTSWSADSRWVAFEVEAADTLIPGMLDTATGTVVDPQPAEGPSPGGYNAYSPRYRHTDGLLAVGCCLSPHVITGEPQRSPLLVLHDPHTGREKERIVLPFWLREADYDPSGAHLLLVASDGRVYRQRNGRFIAVPGIVGVDRVAW